MKPPTFDQVCEKALRLPCSPLLLPRLISVLAKEDSSADELEKIIRMDPALASSTLRLANSAFFAAATPVDSLSEAVFRLGQRETYRLAALSLAGRWMSVEVDGYRWEPGDFCRHSLCRAIAAQLLAERTGRADPSVAYTAGLVSTVGKLAIAYACSDCFADIRTEQKARNCTWLEAEHTILGYDYAEAGCSSGASLPFWWLPRNSNSTRRRGPRMRGLSWQRSTPPSTSPQPWAPACPRKASCSRSTATS
jgi:HD-like signal output (HDOD) protein